MCLSQLLGSGDRGRESQARMNTALGARGRPAGQGHPGAGRQAGSLAPGRGLQRVSKVSSSAPGPTRPQPAARGRRPVGFSLGDRGSLSGRPQRRGPETLGRWSRAGLPHSPQGSSSSDPIPARPSSFSVKLLILRLIVDPPVAAKNSPEGGCLHFALFSPKAPAESRTTSHHDADTITILGRLSPATHACVCVCAPAHDRACT